MIPLNACANAACFRPRARGMNLCVHCQDIKECAIIGGICFGFCFLLIVAVKFWGLV